MFGKRRSLTSDAELASPSERALVRALTLVEPPESDRHIDYDRSEAVTWDELEREGKAEFEGEVLQTFDADGWDLITALGVFATGVALPLGKTQCRVLKAAIRRLDFNAAQAIATKAALPDRFLLLLSQTLEPSALTHQPKAPLNRPNDWIRYALQAGLSVSYVFWENYYRWRASRWSEGFQVAYLGYACAGTDGREFRPISAWIPAEATWHLRLGIEQSIAVELKSGPLYFVFDWKVLPNSVEEAVLNRRKTFKARVSETAEKRVERIGEAGSHRVDQIIQSVRVLARMETAVLTHGGKYHFGIKRLELIKKLKAIDESLATIPDSAFHKVLPGIVVGLPRGRPRTA